jgi:hypothetical protein
MSDYNDFKRAIWIPKVMAEAIIKTYFGERCPDFDKDCECCKRWKLLDQLFENPFDSTTSKREML